MATLADRMEFDPTSPHSQVQNPGWHKDYQPQIDRARKPYQTPALIAARNTPFFTQAMVERVTGREYDVPRLIHPAADVIFVMAPGRPIDWGLANKLDRTGTGVYNVQRSIVDSLDFAGSSPYAGIYTGLTGSIDQEF